MYCVTHKLCFAVLPKAVSLQTLVRPKHTSKKRSARRAWMRRKSNRSGHREAGDLRHRPSVDRHSIRYSNRG